MPICDAVEAVKSASSRWLKTQGDEFGSFAWQAGDGVFAVSSSNIRRVCAYIASQREHHRRTDFRDEYRGLLERHQAPTRGCTPGSCCFAPLGLANHLALLAGA